MKIISLIPVLFLMLSGCGLYQKPFNHASPLVRVLIGTSPELKIKPMKNFIFSANTRKEMGEGTLDLTLSNDYILVNGLPASTEMLEIYPNQYFEYQGKKYRGSARIIKDGNDLMLVNIIDLESYLYSVLPSEVQPEWNMQALKAQAIVSRTFALFELAGSKKSQKSYDLYADTRSQVYLGMAVESKFTSLAVDSTMGEVLRYEGKIIQSFFHASSGGMTESAKEVFGDEKSYLTPVESPYAALFKDNKWEMKIPEKQFEKALHLSTNVLSINVTERTESKRIKAIEIMDAESNKIAISGKDFRSIIGGTAMKSTRANIRMTNHMVYISGMGYGHGVGMGQWDALGMANQGFQYHDIVAFFYHGTTVDKIW